MRRCQNICGLTSTPGNGGFNTRIFGTGHRPFTIRLGKVAIRSVSATTNGMPAELGNTNTIRRRNPRAVRIASTTLVPIPSARYLHVSGVNQMLGRGIGLEAHVIRQRVVRSDQRDQLVAPQRLGGQVAGSVSERRKGEVDFAVGQLFAQ